MTFYVPKIHYNPQIEQITIPNKNIQSYYMKSENSYFVKEEEKFSEYKKDEDNIITVIITPSDIIIGSSPEDCVVLTSDAEKYKNENIVQEQPVEEKPVQNTQEETTQENNKNFKKMFEKPFIPQNLIEDCEFFDKLFLFGNFAKKNFSTIFECQIFILKKIQQIYAFNCKNSFINFVFNDTLTRTEIICFIDMFINLMHCKGIMVMPYSLVSCFGYNLSNASVFVKYGNFTSLCFIEDNCWIDCNYIKEDNEDSLEIFYDCDTEDFVEEFNKPRFHLGNRIYGCKFCDAKYETVSKIVAHIKDCHLSEVTDDTDDSFSEYYFDKQDEKNKIESCDLEENLNTLLANNFDADKIRKIGGNIILVGDFENKQYSLNFGFEPQYKVDKHQTSAIRGAFAFVSLDCSKEMWMTDKEWQNGRLRILKEKLLFYI